MTLNLKDPRGLEVFQRLAEKADVVVENFRPDVKAKLGIDYESVRKINPRIVYGSISGFGQDGPYHKRPGFDQIAQGMGGLMSITGAPGGGPMRVGIPVADLTAGLFCAIGILTAQLERDVSGEGQWVQTSLLQAQIFMLDFQAARWLLEKDVAKQAGNNHPTSIPTGVFKTSDGYINIATTGGRIWERCAQAIGAPELVSNPDYATAPARSKNRDALNAEISKLTEKKSTETWVRETQRRRRALRPDLCDRPDVRGRPSQASRHRPGRSERREPPHPAWERTPADAFHPAAWWNARFRTHHRDNHRVGTSRGLWASSSIHPLEV
jgi:crotonobetainyl-CoA:carnitine CoA-transferase CaiB-like acyl-CoA transferase